MENGCASKVLAVGSEGEKKHKKGGVELCSQKTFTFLTLKNCSQVQSLK